MGHFEYKVIPAPRSGVRSKGAKGPAGRFAGALENAINELATDGWEYIRAESLPVDERHGIAMRKTEIYQNVLVFRRSTDAADDIPPIAAPIEERTEETAAPDDLFKDINDDFPEENADDDAIEDTNHATNETPEDATEKT